MDEFSIKISGLKEVQKAIYAYGNAVGDKIVIDALTTGGKVIRDQAKHNAPRHQQGRRLHWSKGRLWPYWPPGRLKRAIVLRKSKIYAGKGMNQNTLGVYITVNPGRKREDLRGAYYRFVVEHRRGYMSRAFNSMRDQAINKAVVYATFKMNELKRREGLK